MKKEIVVLQADRKQSSSLCDFLHELNYRTKPLYTTDMLLKEIKPGRQQVLILDLDTVPTDKSLFRKLNKTNPSLTIVRLSNRTFHPELEEAMSCYIYACLSKPLDEEELAFWIKSMLKPISQGPSISPGASP